MILIAERSDRKKLGGRILTGLLGVVWWYWRGKACRPMFARYERAPATAAVNKRCAALGGEERHDHEETTSVYNPPVDAV